MKRRELIRGLCLDVLSVNSGQVHPRLGLVIAKRWAKHSVLRNLIKRQVREAFRDHSERLHSKDYVFRLARPLNELPKAPNERRQWVRNDVETLFRRLLEAQQRLNLSACIDARG
jgi:ribonuclease P protein component